MFADAFPHRSKVCWNTSTRNKLTQATLRETLSGNVSLTSVTDDGILCLLNLLTIGRDFVVVIYSLHLVVLSLMSWGRISCALLKLMFIMSVFICWPNRIIIDNLLLRYGDAKHHATGKNSITVQVFLVTLQFVMYLYCGR